MSARAEDLLCQMRARLTRAAAAERAGDRELADALGASAANKLALAVREDNVTELPAARTADATCEE